MAAPKRSQRMQVVLQLAHKAEEAAAKQLQNSRETLQNAEAQFQQLSDYQQQYLAELNQAQGHVNMSRAMNDRQFLQQVSGLMANQKQQIEQLRATEESCLNQWRQQHQRRRNIERLIERLRHEESEQADKQLQKLMDELSAQSLRRQGSDC